jgi:hypothetical protein
MTGVLHRLLLLILSLSSVALAQDDVVMKAMRDELTRSTGQLRLTELDKPYFISYRGAPAWEPIYRRGHRRLQGLRGWS